MKKETAILAIVIAFVVGFVSGATVAILKKTKNSEKVDWVQKPQRIPQGGEVNVPQGLNPLEVTSKIQMLKEMVKKDSKNLSAWIDLGNLYFDSGQPKEAIEAYSQALTIKPDHADVRTDMGIMYRQLGDFDQAIQEFKKAAQSDPRHLNSRYNIGIVLLHDKQDMKGAIQAWEEYLKVDSTSERAKRIKDQIEKMKKMVK